MATYLEITALMFDKPLKKKVCAALFIAAKDFLDEASPTVSEEKWAAEVLENPDSQTVKALRYILGKNNGSTVAVIQAATDASIQTNVDAIVDNLVSAFNA